MVLGLGISAHRDAMPVLRMQPCIQNQGYAAGLIAATASADPKALREIDIRGIQEKLVEKGSLPREVLEHEDSYFSKQRMQEAVNALRDNWRDLPVVLAQTEDSIPMMQQAYAQAINFNHKLIYAQTLGMLGDNTGVETIIKSLRGKPWDQGWNFRGGGQFGASMSRMDVMVKALGKSGDKRGIEAIITKARQLTQHDDFSHFRAVGIALENLADEGGAEVLAELLRSPGMSGYNITKESVYEDLHWAHENVDRSLPLREIILARALYRCGDYNGLAEQILQNYVNDLRGHFSRHAYAILQQGKLDK